jgi:hypothetical protein
MPTIRHVLAGLTILLVSLPASVLLTLLLLPFWRWLEATYDIESVGHSGPAEWCFETMFVACIVALVWLYALTARRAGPSDTQ